MKGQSSNLCGQAERLTLPKCRAPKYKLERAGSTYQSARKLQATVSRSNLFVRTNQLGLLRGLSPSQSCPFKMPQQFGRTNILYPHFVICNILVALPRTPGRQTPVTGCGQKLSSSRSSNLCELQHRAHQARYFGNVPSQSGELLKF